MKSKCEDTPAATPKAKAKVKAKIEKAEKPERVFAFDFDPSACEKCGGRCCKNEYGRDENWVNPLSGKMEKQQIWKAIPLTKEQYEEIEAYCVSESLSHETLKVITSVDDKGAEHYSYGVFHGYDDCEFLIEGKCAVQPVKPPACRMFPFSNFVVNELEFHMKECPGIKLKS